MNFSITLLTGRKRKRCGTCENCFAVECGICKYCLDKPKFGGNGVLRQSCINKKCHNMTSTSQGEYVQVSREFDCITELQYSIISFNKDMINEAPWCVDSPADIHLSDNVLLVLKQKKRKTNFENCNNYDAIQYCIHKNELWVLSSQQTNMARG